jgi:uncharacterized membrane protein
MRYIKSVTPQGDETYRWVMAGPNDVEAEWITETTRLEPNKRIAWKTIEGDLKTSGQVTFTELLSALNNTGAFIGEVRAKLDVGTEINAPPVVALEFDADLLGISAPTPPAPVTRNGR